MGEHPQAIIERLCQHHGVPPAEALSLLLSCLTTQHAMRSLGRSSEGNAHTEIESLRELLGPDTPVPASLLEALGLVLKLDRQLALRRARSHQSQGQDDKPLLHEAKTAEVLLLILQEAMNAADLAGVAASLRLDEWRKKYGISPPPADETQP